MDSITINGLSIKWLGKSGFMIKSSDLVIYIDPCGIAAGDVNDVDMADLLMITHEGFGHCDPTSIRSVRKFDCTTLIPEDMSLDFRGDARRVVAGDSLSGELSIKGVDIDVLPTYGCAGDSYPPGTGVAYLFELGGLKIYHAGHTCSVPETEGISADIVFLPIAGGDVMDSERACDTLALLLPGHAIPIYVPEGDPGHMIAEFISIAGEKCPSVKVHVL